MEYSLRRLLVSNGTWGKLESDWEQQCSEVNDYQDGYAVDSLPVLKQIAEKEEPESRQRITWAVALYDTSRALAVAMVNLAPIPNYDKPVLRIRQVTVCPLLDFGALSEDTYADTLVQIMWQLYKISEDSLKSGHIHMHLRSPTDVAFFRAFGKNLDGSSVFDSVTHQGAWLRIAK